MIVATIDFFESLQRRQSIIPNNHNTAIENTSHIYFIKKIIKKNKQFIRFNPSIINPPYTTFHQSSRAPTANTNSFARMHSFAIFATLTQLALAACI